MEISFNSISSLDKLEKSIQYAQLAKKVIFFDIDGTIVTEDEQALIPESTVRAIKKARENGNYTFINTGRTIFNVQDRIKNLGFDGFLCGCGTYI